MPEPEPMDAITATMKQDAYESARRLWREVHPHRTREDIATFNPREN